VHVEQTENEIFVDSVKKKKRGKTQRGNTERVLQGKSKFYHQTDVALDKGVPVTTALLVLRLRMEKRPPIWWIAANMLNKKSRTADDGLSSSLRVGRGANKSSP
jgi:hypothetical protein